jgi:hypothetical protein
MITRDQAIVFLIFMSMTMAFFMGMLFAPTEITICR